MKIPANLTATGVAMSLVLMTTTMNGGVVLARRNDNSSNENPLRYPPRQPSTLSSLEVNYGYAGAWGLPVVDYSVNDPHSPLPDPGSDQGGNDDDSRRKAITHTRRAPAAHKKITSDANNSNDRPNNFIQQVASRRIQRRKPQASHDDHVSKNRGTQNMEETTAPLSRAEQVFFVGGVSQHHSFSEYLDMSDGLE